MQHTHHCNAVNLTKMLMPTQSIYVPQINVKNSCRTVERNKKNRIVQELNFPLTPLKFFGMPSISNIPTKRVITVHEKQLPLAACIFAFFVSTTPAHGLRLQPCTQRASLSLHALHRCVQRIIYCLAFHSGCMRELRIIAERGDVLNGARNT